MAARTVRVIEYASKHGQEPTHRWLELASGRSLTTDLTKSAGMALVLPELAKDVDISPNEVFQNTGARASVSGLADAVNLATSSVATAEALKQAGYHTIVAQHDNRTSNEVGTMEAVKLTQLAATAKQGSLLGVRGGGIVIRSHAVVSAGADAGGNDHLDADDAPLLDGNDDGNGVTASRDEDSSIAKRRRQTAKEYNEKRWQKQVDLYGEKQAKEMRTDARRQQRLDKNKRNAEVKKRGAAVRVCVCMRACVI